MIRSCRKGEDGSLSGIQEVAEELWLHINVTINVKTLPAIVADRSVLTLL